MINTVNIRKKNVESVKLELRANQDLISLQDYDSHLLRVQPAHHVAPGGLGVAGRQRLGRSCARTGGFEK